MRFSKTRCFELMNEALQAPVRLECGSDVEPIRQRFYRARAAATTPSGDQDEYTKSSVMSHIYRDGRYGSYLLNRQEY